MKIKWKSVNRTIHYWGSSICALPLLLVIITGILLLLKKESNWIQPPTVRGMSKVPTISFDAIIKSAKKAKEANINDWSDVSRLDVRPSKGVIKLQSKNGWEVQIDHQNAEILQIAYRRSDLIESLHDGTFFSRKISYFLFLPCALILLILWISGIYLFITMLSTKNNNRRRKKEAIQNSKKTQN